MLKETQTVHSLVLCILSRTMLEVHVNLRSIYTAHWLDLYEASFCINTATVQIKSNPKWIVKPQNVTYAQSQKTQEIKKKSIVTRALNEHCQRPANEHCQRPATACINAQTEQSPRCPH